MCTVRAPVLLCQTDVAVSCPQTLAAFFYLPPQKTVCLFVIKLFFFFFHISGLFTRRTQVFTSFDPSTPANKQTNKQTKQIIPKNPTTSKQQIADVLEILNFLLSSCVSPNNETLNVLALASSFILFFYLLLFFCTPIYFNKCAYCFLFFVFSSCTDKLHKLWNMKPQEEVRVRQGAFFVAVCFFFAFNSCTLTKRLHQLSGNI